jgi:hypothetical protein
MSRCPLAFNEPVVELLYYVGPTEELCNQGENPNKTTITTLPEHSQNQLGQRK